MLRPSRSHDHRTTSFALHRFASECEIIPSQIPGYDALLAGSLTKFTIRTCTMQDRNETFVQQLTLLPETLISHPNELLVSYVVTRNHVVTHRNCAAAHLSHRPLVVTACRSSF